MNTKLPLLLLLLPAISCVASAQTATAKTAVTAVADEQSPASILAAQLEEITSSTTLSRKSQAKLITSAVRLAVSTALEGIKDPSRRLEVATELANAAAKAAPQFATTIANAILELPVIAEVEGAIEQVQAAVSAALESTEAAEIANPAATPPRAPANPEFGGPNRGETVVSPSS